jgi:hypothetical protein
VIGPIYQLADKGVELINDYVGIEPLTNAAAWVDLHLPREGIMWGWAVGVTVVGLVFVFRQFRTHQFRPA